MKEACRENNQYLMGAYFHLIKAEDSYLNKDQSESFYHLISASNNLGKIEGTEKMQKMLHDMGARVLTEFRQGKVIPEVKMEFFALEPELQNLVVDLIVECECR